MQDQFQKQSKPHTQKSVSDSSSVFEKTISYISISEMCQRTNLPEFVILEFFDQEVFLGFQTKRDSNLYYFESNAPALLEQYLRNRRASEQKHQCIRAELPQLSQTQSVLLNAPDVPVHVTPGAKVASNDEDELKSMSVPISKSPTSFVVGNLQVQKKPMQVPLIQANTKPISKSIYLSDVTDEAIVSNVCERKIRIYTTEIKGLYLEISASKRNLIVKGKRNGVHSRVVIESWETNQGISLVQLDCAVKAYNKIKVKLGRAPDQHEFKLHSHKVEVIGDVLHAHLEFNVKNKHGEGSEEWKQITALIKNYFSKNIVVDMPNGTLESILLMNEKLENMTQARFKSYLRSFAESNGIHDKIVTRIKAAMNFCFNERLIGRDDIYHFHNVKRINRQRHVEFSDEDLKALFEYLDSSENTDFRFFMNLQSTGHFRTNQVIGMKYAQVDFNHSTVKVKPKNGIETEIAIPADITQMISDRMQTSSSEYLFPSQRAEKGHKANFDKEWSELRVALGFFTELTDGEVKYKYRLHDFRESLLGRLEDLDDLTLSSLLGHLSLHSLKHYRKANKKLVKRATELGYGKLQEVSCSKT